MKRAVSFLAGMTLAALAPGIAQACAVLDPLRPGLVAATSVVVRGTVTAIDVDVNGETVMTVSVAESLKGEPAESWRVAWDAGSIIGPPQTIEESEARFGHDVVVGLVPAENGEAVLAQEMCAEPFLGSWRALGPLLHEQGLAE